MTISAPSARRAAVDTSDVKSTWPGESMRFTTYCGLIPSPCGLVHRSAIELDFMVIWRSCSSTRESM